MAFCADNVELGTACGKLHRVSVLAITDPGAGLAAVHHVWKPLRQDRLSSESRVLAVQTGDSDILKSQPGVEA